MIETSGRFTISRIYSNNRGGSNCIEVVIKDNTNRIIVSIELELKEFAMALTGFGDVPANLSIYNQ